MIEDYWYALIGGALIGLASSLILAANGRIAGISGILFGAITGRKFEAHWRWAFLIGLLVGGLASAFFLPGAFVNTSGRSLALVATAGLLVGYGTRLGSGCTSGHGVCGISRLSTRSLVATCTFIVTGVVAVFIVNLVKGS